MQRIENTINPVLLGLVVASVAWAAEPSAASTLEAGFQSPPPEARLHAYWWWLNGNVTAGAITRDLEAMAEKGFGGALITDAGGASQDGNRQVPRGPLFGSEPWRKLYRHALREGRRLNLEMALNIQSGWNLGGPGVKADDAAKILCWSETLVTGPGAVTKQLPAPGSRHGLLGEVAVLAVPEHAGAQTEGQGIPHTSIARWEEKTLIRPVGGANRDTSFLIPGWSGETGDGVLDPQRIINLARFTDCAGNLQWNVPDGSWRVYRFCYTVSPGARVSTCTEGWEGLALDPMDAAAFQRYWDAVVEPLMLDAKQVGGNALKYLHTDSWEIEPFNWTAGLPEAFQRRCGYDLVPWLPVLARRVVDGGEASERFLHDFRKTVAALVAENYYYGDHAPNFAGLRASNPAQLPAGYDYDVATEHVLLHRVAVKNGRIVLPDGMSYAALVLPPHRCMSLPVLRKLDELAEAGAILVGPRPDSSSGLTAWQADDAEARRLIERLWGGERRDARVEDLDAPAWLKETRLLPDFACAGTDPGRLDFVHRRDGETDIYFVGNPGREPVRADVCFRVWDRRPEFWDPRDGTIRALPEWRATKDGRIEVPVTLDAFGSGFVVFRSRGQESAIRSQGAGRNFPDMKPVFEIAGAWEVAFDPAWFYPDNGSGGRMVFDKLADWTKHPAEAVRHFSGTAVYRTSFDLPAAPTAEQGPLHLSLGEVREMARVTLNGRELGIAWCPPWCVPVPAGVLAGKDNRLVIEVVNFWPNRLIGDAKLPPGQRRTKTNITKFENPKGDKHYTTLMPSGLLGPVRIVNQNP